jgi:hypothetical protein
LLLGEAATQSAAAEHDERLDDRRVVTRVVICGNCDKET